MRTFLLGIASLTGAATSDAQSTIYGLNLIDDVLYTSDTADFVGNYAEIDMSADKVRAIDFDATATTLWGIKNDTREYGTIDLSTGAFTVMGTVTGPTGGITGLTAAADGSTWYLSEWDLGLGSSFLYVGDVTTGSFTQVGLMEFQTFIDLSIDSQGNLYAYTISDDSLYEIDTTTGAGTLIGPTGHPTIFAQGMDFDWSDDTLYATICGGLAGSVFATMDLTTGAANVLQDTAPVGVELEMAVKVPVPVPAGTPYCLGDGSRGMCPCGNAGGAGEGCANSTGAGGLLEGSGTSSAGADDLVLSAARLPPGQPTLLFVGLNAINGGLGVPFGDGLRCAGGGVVRLGVMTPDSSGGASWGPGLRTVGGWSDGDTRRFQAWYRDPAGSPCGFAFNLTNGFEVAFVP